MSGAKSPLAPERFPDIPSVGGVRFAALEAGVKYSGRTDLMLAVMDPGTTVAGVFTTSATRSAPVLDCQAKIGGASDRAAAFLVNSGNANAFTGKHGEGSVARICAGVSAATGVAEDRVFTASTGVIGERLPDDRITAKLAEANSVLSPDGIEGAANAILTTDTYAKGSVQQVDVGGQTVTIAGIAKGSGMIAPDMATMLVYIFTDAVVAQDRLQELTRDVADMTFNRITVDSDTSTSDSLLFAATGATGVDAGDSPEFAAAVYAVMLDLAHQVVRDGEGATKFVAVTVTGAADEADATKAALSIANSPLVKTAIAGEDPNWGRIVMAVGKSGAQADRDKLSISFGDIVVAEQGWVAESYREEDGAAYMKNQDLEITADLGVGTASSTVWTCDLTHGYITINADYRS